MPHIQDSSHDTASIAVITPWGPIPTAPTGHSWDSLMDEALRQATLAEKQGEVPVGAVVVSADGIILGRGQNQCIRQHDPTAHAEIVALRHAAQTQKNYRLTKCVMVVTLEPCLMCVGALVHARIGGIVYGAADRKMGAVHSCLDGFSLPFHNHWPWFLGGIQSVACAAQLQNFFQQRR